jgi:hypothetical protein
MATHGMPWSEEQREWLRALGHDVLMPAPADGQAFAPEPIAPHASAVESRGRAAPAAGAPTPLLRALARAAGRGPDDAEFLQVLPDLATLRGNPAARRALWPRLRSLRRRTAR